jgi:hypothetical protein
MSGVLGGGSVKQPTYDVDKAIKTQNMGVNSILGNMSVQRNRDGSYSNVYDASQADTQRTALINQLLGNVSGDPTKAENAYYNSATRLLNSDYAKQRSAMDENLTNRGIAVGSKAYGNAMSNLDQTHYGQLGDIANNAVGAGQQYQSNIIDQSNALSGGMDTTKLASMAGTNNAYDAAMGVSQTNAANKAQAEKDKANAIGSIAGGLALFSDERLKENLVPVGKLDNGLTVYVGNYKPETGLDTRPQLFLIAQEVEKVRPDAVAEKDGYLTVDYKKATDATTPSSSEFKIVEVK